MSIWYKCRECDETFREDEMSTSERDVGDYPTLTGWGTQYEDIGVCPHCGSDSLDEVSECNHCTDAAAVKFNLCEDCYDECKALMTVHMKKIFAILDEYNADYDLIIEVLEDVDREWSGR